MSSLDIFFVKRKPTLRALKVIIKKKLNTASIMYRFRFLYICMIMSILMSANIS